jgi:hypothetical protein
LQTGKAAFLYNVEKDGFKKTRMADPVIFSPAMPQNECNSHRSGKSLMQR